MAPVRKNKPNKDNNEDRPNNECPSSTTPDSSDESGRGQGRGRGRRRGGRGRAQVQGYDPTQFQIQDPIPRRGRVSARGYGRCRGCGYAARGVGSGSAGVQPEPDPRFSTDHGNRTYPYDLPMSFLNFPGTLASESSIPCVDSIVAAAAGSSNARPQQVSDDSSPQSPRTPDSPQSYSGEVLTPPAEEILGIMDTMVLFKEEASSSSSPSSTGANDQGTSSEASRHPNLAQILEASSQAASTSGTSSGNSVNFGTPPNSEADEMQLSLVRNQPNGPNGPRTRNRRPGQANTNESRISDNIPFSPEPMLEEQFRQRDQGMMATGRTAESQLQVQRWQNEQSEERSDEAQIKLEKKRARRRNARSIKKRREAEAQQQLELQTNAVGQEALNKEVKKEPIDSFGREAGAGAGRQVHHGGTPPESRPPANNAPQFQQQQVQNGGSMTQSSQGIRVPVIQNTHSYSVSMNPSQMGQPNQPQRPSNGGDNRENHGVPVNREGCINCARGLHCEFREAANLEAQRRAELSRMDSNFSFNPRTMAPMASQQFRPRNGYPRQDNANQGMPIPSFNQDPPRHVTPIPLPHLAPQQQQRPQPTSAQTLAQVSQRNGNFGTNREQRPQPQTQMQFLRDGLKNSQRSQKPDPYVMLRPDNVTPPAREQGNQSQSQGYVPFQAQNQLAPIQPQPSHMAESYSGSRSGNATPGFQQAQSHGGQRLSNDNSKQCYTIEYGASPSPSPSRGRIHDPNAGPRPGNATPGFQQAQGQASHTVRYERYPSPSPSRGRLPGPYSRPLTVGFPLPVLLDPNTSQPLVRQRLMSIAEVDDQIFPNQSSDNSLNQMAPPAPPPQVKVKMEQEEASVVWTRDSWRAYQQQKEAARRRAQGAVETITLRGASEDEVEAQEPWPQQVPSSSLNVTHNPYRARAPLPTARPYEQPQEWNYNTAAGRAPEVRFGQSQILHAQVRRMEGNSFTMSSANGISIRSQFSAAVQQEYSIGYYQSGLRPPPSWVAMQPGPRPPSETRNMETRPRPSATVTWDNRDQSSQPAISATWDTQSWPRPQASSAMSEFNAGPRLLAPGMSSAPTRPWPPAAALGRPAPAAALGRAPPSAALGRPPPATSVRPGPTFPTLDLDRPAASASVGAAPLASAFVPMNGTAMTSAEAINSSRLQTLAAVAAAAETRNRAGASRNFTELERNTDSVGAAAARLHSTPPVAHSVSSRSSTMSNVVVKPEESGNPAGGGALDLRKVDNVPKRDGDGSGSGGVGGVRLCTWCSKRNICTPNNGLMGSTGSWTYCSERCYEQFRRDVFKRRAACLWCSNLNSQGQYLNSVSMHSNVDESKFCSEYCLNQFKLKLFFETVESETTNLQLKESHGALALSALPGTSLGFTSSKDLITPASWLSASTSSHLPLTSPSLSGKSSPAPLPVITAPHVSPELTGVSFIHNGTSLTFAPSKPGSVTAHRLSLSSQRPPNISTNSFQKLSHASHPLNNSSPPKRIRLSSGYHGTYRTGHVTPHSSSKPRSQAQAYGTPSRTVNPSKQDEQNVLFGQKWAESVSRRTLPSRPSEEADSGSGKPDSTFVPHMNSEKEPTSSPRQEQKSEAEKAKVIFVIPYPYPLVIPFPLPFSMYNSLMASQGMERNTQKSKSPLLLHDQLELD